MHLFDRAALMGLWLSVFLTWLAHPAAQDPLDHMLPGNKPSRSGVIVPLYIYPGAAWDRLVQVKNNYPRVPMIAVINPNSGPGGDQNPDYVTGIQSLHRAGIKILGYVHTGYASRSREAVVADIGAYEQWYELDGIFFDEMSTSAGNEDYYAYLADYAKSAGFKFTIANPAASILPSYIGTVDMLVIYEDAGLPGALPLAGWHGDYARRNFALIAHSVQTIDESFVAGASEHVSYMYITDDVPPNPYDTLPGYFEQLVAVLSRLQPGR
jgi:hypothetical protein